MGNISLLQGTLLPLITIATLVSQGVPSMAQEDKSLEKGHWLTQDSLSMDEDLSDLNLSQSSSLITQGGTSSELRQELRVNPIPDVDGQQQDELLLEDNFTPSELRQELRVEPIPVVNSQQIIYAPATSAGIPSAFGANWGDFYVGLAASTADNVRDEVDGGTILGFGLGDNRRAIGLEFNYNNLSIRDFAANGSFNAKVHRIVYGSNNTQVALAVGWDNFANYGSDPEGTPSSVYGLVNVYHFLSDNPENPLPINLSLGLGGAPIYSESDVGIIAGAGMQVHPNIGLSVAWSGLGVNLGASYLPVRTLPLTLNVIYGDVFNNSDGGSILAIGVSYGFDFTPNF